MPEIPQQPYVDPLIKPPSNPFEPRPQSYLEEYQHRYRDCNALGRCAIFGIRPCDCYH